MIIGVPKEIKDFEYRVALVPSGVERLKKQGHQVLVEKSAGIGVGISDKDYADAGAEVVSSAEEVFGNTNVIVKVKEPLPQEYSLIRSEQILFTYFHFAASAELTRAMVDSGACCVAYETIRSTDGSLPLLKPMSEIAGRMSVQEGAKCLESPMDGKGVLLSGTPGVAPANVVVIGGGVVGTNAARVAAGMGAHVTIMDVDTDRLRYLDDIMPKNVVTLHSNDYNIRSMLSRADLVIGAVLLCGRKAPVLVSRDMLKLMQPGSVLVDVAVDQGGCFETTHATTHSEPTYKVDGIVHYCVANMPGAVAKTATYALTNETLPYLLRLASMGSPSALLADSTFCNGVNISEGKVHIKGLTEQFCLACN